MGRYAATATPAGINTANSVHMQLRPSNASVTLRVVKIVVAVVTAPTNAPVWQLRRSTAVGATPTAMTVMPYDTGDASLVSADTSPITTPPTLATGALDGGAFPAVIGNAWVWTFYDQPLIVRGTANGLCLVNTIAAGATLGSFQVTGVWDE